MRKVLRERMNFNIRTDIHLTQTTKKEKYEILKKEKQKQRTHRKERERERVRAKEYQK